MCLYPYDTGNHTDDDKNYDKSTQEFPPVIRKKFSNRKFRVGTGVAIAITVSPASVVIHVLLH
jgi:hypothetical protein